MVKKKGTISKNTKRLFIWLGVILLLLLVANIFLFKRFIPVEEPTEVAKPKLAIVIDDLGYDQKQAQILYQIEPHITLAVLPHQPHSNQIARYAKARGQEVLLHLPMEPHNYEKYGKAPHMLLADMTLSELMRELTYNLDSLPSAVGVNNHMGSRMTEDEGLMEIILGELKQRGLFFIDSRTTHESVAYLVAKQLGVRTYERDIFLDNVDEVGAITSQLEELVILAKQEGKALGIGHPRPNTFIALKNLLQDESMQEVQLVYASELLE